MTLKEYLEDYASAETRAIGEKLIEEEIKKLENPDIKSTVEKDLVKIHSGERNFKF